MRTREGHSTNLEQILHPVIAIRLRRGPPACMSGPVKIRRHLCRHVTGYLSRTSPSSEMSKKRRKFAIRLAPALHHTSRPRRPGTHYNIVLQASTISEHKHRGIVCRAVCAKCVPYSPVLHRFLPCWDVVTCLLPSMFGQLP